jgi:hypothetical protein
VRSRYNTAFSFLDDRHFVIPSVRSGRRGDIVLNVYQFCPCPRPCPQRRCQQARQETLAGILVRDYVLRLRCSQGHPRAPVLPGRQRRCQCRCGIPAGPFLRRPFEARVWHPSRSEVLVDEAGDDPGTTHPASRAQRPDARAGLSSHECLLRAAHRSVRVRVWGCDGRAKDTHTSREASASSARRRRVAVAVCCLLWCCARV